MIYSPTCGRLYDLSSGCRRNACFVQGVGDNGLWSRVCTEESVNYSGLRDPGISWVSWIFRITLNTKPVSADCQASLVLLDLMQRRGSSICKGFCHSFRASKHYSKKALKKLETWQIPRIQSPNCHFQRASGRCELACAE